MKRILSTLSRKWPEYLLEILVLIIGIYGAFALENWNDKRSNNKFESDILTLIGQNLEKDSLSLIEISRQNNKAIQAMSVLLTAIPENLTEDSIAIYLGDIINFDRFRPSISAFEVLKSNGLNNISDPELRVLLSTYYDDNVQHLLQSLQDVENSFNADFVPMLKKDFEDFNFKEYAKPYHPQEFVAQRDLLSYLRIFRDNRRGVREPVKKALYNISTIRMLIKSKYPGQFK